MVINNLRPSATDVKDDTVLLDSMWVESLDPIWKFLSEPQNASSLSHHVPGVPRQVQNVSGEAVDSSVGTIHGLTLGPSIDRASSVRSITYFQKR